MKAEGPNIHQCVQHCSHQRYPPTVIHIRHMPCFSYCNHFRFLPDARDDPPSPLTSRTPKRDLGIELLLCNASFKLPRGHRTPGGLMPLHMFRGFLEFVISSRVIQCRVVIMCVTTLPFFPLRRIPAVAGLLAC